MPVPPSADEVALRRRRFLRGGAFLAAAAGGAAVAAIPTTPASAATGDALTVGGTFSGPGTTVLKTSDPRITPLSLVNDQGPALLLPPVPNSWNATLAVGALVSTTDGLMIGVAGETGPVTTSVATGLDLAVVPSYLSVDPQRVLDTKTDRSAVVRTSSSKAIDSSGRLTKGSWVDVAVGALADEQTALAAFLTVTASGSSKDGWLSAYAPDADRAGTVTTSFLKKKTLSGAAFVEVAVVRSAYAVRIEASQTARVQVDLTGLNVIFVQAASGPEPLARVAGTRSSQRVLRQRTTTRR